MERRRARRAARDHHPHPCVATSPACAISATRSRARPVATAATNWAPAVACRRSCSTTTRRSPYRSRSVTCRPRPTRRSARRHCRRRPSCARYCPRRCAIASTRSARWSSACVEARTPRPRGGNERVELPSLMTLAMCCRRGDRVRFTYRDGADRVERASRRAASAGVARPALVPRRLRSRSRRLAHVSRRPRQRAGHVRPPQHAAPDAGRGGARRRGRRRARVRHPRPRSR